MTVRPVHDSALRNPRSAYRAIVFDRDGTAVVDRREDAEPFIGLAETLLTLGGLCQAAVCGFAGLQLDRGRPLTLRIGDLRARLGSGHTWHCRWESQVRR